MPFKVPVCFLEATRTTFNIKFVSISVSFFPILIENLEVNFTRLFDRSYSRPSALKKAFDCAISLL